MNTIAFGLNARIYFEMFRRNLKLSRVFFFRLILVVTRSLKQRGSCQKWFLREWYIFAGRVHFGGEKGVGNSLHIQGGVKFCL